jgi:Ca-activated chloride channel family protein
MTWDADLTDMDLHVLEPSFEEAYYGHNLTTIGGKVSRDFTQGYGPEVYSVRKAMKGLYKVKTKFFGSSAAQLQGAVTLQVDVYTNWGRKNEKRQSMTLRLTENKEEFVVGEVKF